MCASLTRAPLTRASPDPTPGRFRLFHAHSVRDAASCRRGQGQLPSRNVRCEHHFSQYTLAQVAQRRASNSKTGELRFCLDSFCPGCQKSRDHSRDLSSCHFCVCNTLLPGEWPGNCARSGGYPQGAARIQAHRIARSQAEAGAGTLPHPCARWSHGPTRRWLHSAPDPSLGA
jgi:hypothetical protein